MQGKILLTNNIIANFSQSIRSLTHLNRCVKHYYFLYAWHVFMRNIAVKHLCAYVANGIKCLQNETNVNFIKAAWGGRSDTEDIKMQHSCHEWCLTVFCGEFSFRHLTVVAGSPLSLSVWILLQTVNDRREKQSHKPFMFTSPVKRWALIWHSVVWLGTQCWSRVD